MAAVVTWLIALAVIVAILIRPKGWPEAVWACGGGGAIILLHLLPFSQAVNAIGKGTDVYLFLTGMMLLAELARSVGVFNWLAGIAVSHARASRARLFGLVYCVGILVTVFLSNDATAIVLTPAVYASIRKARVEPLPYLLACAFIANAASFVLPISNPANLVVYGSHLPPLADWMKSFLLPSFVSILATWAVLRILLSGELAGTIQVPLQSPGLSPEGRRAAWGLVFTGAVLLAASALGRQLGLPTLAAAMVAVMISNRGRGLAGMVRGISWSVLPLVAGLFVLVEAVSATGALHAAGDALARLASLPPILGTEGASFGVAVLSNLINNLPAGLAAGAAFTSNNIPERIRDALLIGVDLGPNLSVTGSLATILWLVAIRREGENISAGRFLMIGALVMPPALLFSTLALHAPVR
jgi:arsenical pump membrane protein